MGILSAIGLWWLSVGFSIYAVIFLADALHGFENFRETNYKDILRGLLGIPFWPLPLYGLREAVVNYATKLVVNEGELRATRRAYEKERQWNAAPYQGWRIANFAYHLRLAEEKLKIYEGPRLTSAGKHIKNLQEENHQLREIIKNGLGAADLKDDHEPFDKKT